MLNNYDTPDHRDTLQFKGNLGFRPKPQINLEWIHLLEETLDPDQNPIIRCQQIILFMNMLHFCTLHLIYLFTPKWIINEMSLLYFISWSLVLICGVVINVNGQSVKRYPLNILVFGFQGGARMFLMLFLFEYFQTSKFILVNMMFVSILGYLRFKTEQQNYYTNMESLEKAGSINLLDQSQPEDPSQVEDEDWKLLMNQQEQYENQQSNEDDNDNDNDILNIPNNASDKDSNYSNDNKKQNKQKLSEHELNDEQRSQLHSQQQILQDLLPKQQKPNQQNLPKYPNIFIIMSFKKYAINYLFALLSPFTLMILFHFSFKQLIAVWIINFIYITILWVHCKAYYSDNRLLVLQYNRENVYLLALNYFDSDILMPWWLIRELLHIKDKQSALRRTRISLN